MSEDRAVCQSWEIENDAQMHAATALLRHDQDTWDKMTAACRAYHRAMIAATPGPCVHEPDGTVRVVTDADWPEIDLLRQQIAKAGFALEDAVYDRERLAVLSGEAP